MAGAAMLLSGILAGRSIAIEDVHTLRDRLEVRRVAASPMRAKRVRMTRSIKVVTFVVDLVAGGDRANIAFI
jgi:hypothetical protein